jgi:hypothetical protein
MPSTDLYQLVQIAYWLALATWFGGVLFVAMAAPIVFRTVRENNPILPHVLSVNLEGQHGTLLAGSIVGDLLARLWRVQMICGGVLLVALVGQFFLIDLTAGNRTAAVVRVTLFVAAVGVALYDGWVLWPRIWRHRQEYLDHADEPEVANPAKDRFDADHRLSVGLLTAVLFLLLGILLFSGNITPRERDHAAPAVGASASVSSSAGVVAEAVLSTTAPRTFH